MSELTDVVRAARSVVVGVAVVAAASLAAFAAGAGAATAPVTPVSLTDCSGSVAADHSGAAQAEPWLLGYKFKCDGNISAYTVVVDQPGDRGGSIDDYAAAPSVFESDGVTPSPTETATCEGTTPSDGINCNFGAGGSLTAGFVTAGTVDPIAPYCPHVTPPATKTTTKSKTKTKTKAKAKKTTKATVAPTPQALVQLIVTDATGAQDGPFTLGPTKACGKKPVVVPAPSTSTKPKSKTKKSS